MKLQSGKVYILSSHEIGSGLCLYCDNSFNFVPIAYMKKDDIFLVIEVSNQRFVGNRYKVLYKDVVGVSGVLDNEYYCTVQEFI